MKINVYNLKFAISGTVLMIATIVGGLVLPYIMDRLYLPSFFWFVLMLIIFSVACFYYIYFKTLKDGNYRDKSLSVSRLIINHLEFEDDLSVEDVVRIGQCEGLSEAEIYHVLSSLYANITKDKKEMLAPLKKLRGAFEKKLPFEDVPSDAQQSMCRLAELCGATGKESDKVLVNDIHLHLRKYQQIQKDHERMKIQAQRSYLFGVAGTFLAIVGLAISVIFAFSSIKKGDVKDAVREGLSTWTNGVSVVTSNVPAIK